MGKRLSPEESAKLGLSYDDGQEEAAPPPESKKPERSLGRVALDTGAGLLDYGAKALKDGQGVGIRTLANLAAGNGKELLKTGMAGLQGVLMEGGDEVAGGIESLGEEVGATLRRKEPSSYREIPLEGQPGEPGEWKEPGFAERLNSRYRKRQGEWEGIFGEATRDNPAAELTGGLVMGGPAKGVLKKALVGGLMGETAGVLGNRETKLLEKPGQALLEAAPMAAIGAVAPVVADKVAAPLAKLSRNKASEEAARAAFGQAQIGDKLERLNYEADDAAKLGREVLKRKLLPWFGGPADVAEGAKRMQGSAGSSIGDVLEQLGATGQRPDMTEAAMDAGRSVLGKGLNAPEKRVLTKAKDFVKDIYDEGARSRQLSPDEAWSELNRLKSEAWDSVNMKDDAPKAAKLFRRAVQGLRDSIEKQAERTGGKPVADQLRNANAEYGLGKDLEALSAGVARRDTMKASPLRKAMMRMAGSVGGSIVGNMVGDTAGAVGGGGAGVWLPEVLGAALPPANIARGLDLSADVLGATIPGLEGSSVPLAELLRAAMERKKQEP